MGKEVNIMSVEYKGAGRFYIRSEVPPEFDGKTDQFGSNIVFETPDTTREQRSLLIKPTCKEGRNYYGRRNFVLNMGA